MGFIFIKVFINFCFHILLIVFALSACTGKKTSETDEGNTARINFDKPNKFLKDSLLLKKEADSLSIECVYATNSNNLALADELSDKALSIYQSLSDSNSIGIMYQRKGWLYAMFGLFDKSLEYLYKSLNYFDNVKGEEKAWAYITLANVFSRSGEQGKIKFYLDKAIQTTNDTGMIRADIFLLYSDYYEYQGNKDSAFVYIEKAIKHALKTKSNEMIKSAYNRLGLYYLDTKDYDKALEAYFNALKYSEDISFVRRSVTLSNISEIYFLKKNYLESIRYGNLSISDNLEVRQQSYYYISQSYYNLGNIENAYEYYKIYDQAKDSLLNREKVNQIKTLEIKYQTEQKQKQIELQQTQLENKDLQLKKQRTALYSAIAILGLLLVVIGLVVNNVRKRKEQQRLLSMKNSELHQQNEEILAQRDEIESQKEIIEQKSKEVTDSITYARYIQQSILPSTEEVNMCFENHFILYAPKDLVSGDFYWTQKVNGVSYCAVSDCTGHGVPGGFMSMLGIALLNEIHATNPMLSPAERLTLLKQMLIETLKQDRSGSLSKDGMDISLLSVDHQKLTMNYASALGKVILVRDGTPTLLEYDRTPVGYSYSKGGEFQNRTVALQRGDLIYAFTDGIVDQLGGNDAKKFGTKRFSEKLGAISALDFTEHKGAIEQEFNRWKDNLNQLDDILVFGIKV